MLRRLDKQLMPLALLIAVLGICTFATDSTAQSRIGLVPSTNSLGRAEAVTASAYGTDALFYNPATLVNNKLSVSLVGIEVYTGAKYEAIEPEELNNRGNIKLEDYFRLLGQQDQVYGATTARSIDISMSYFGATSFAQAHASAQKVDDSHTYKVGTDVGAIAGFAVRIGKLSLGYSQYGLHRVGLEATPTETQIQTINQAIVDEAFDENTVPFREFTEITYGSARGQNFGMLYSPWDDNISGIGIAVLNSGGTEFDDETFLDRKDARKVEQEIQDEASLYNIELQTPEPLGEVINAGIQAGYGGGESGIVQARVGLDFSDISPESTHDDLGASYEFGLHLPNPVALALSWPIFDSHWAYRAAGQTPKGKNFMVHMGLLSLKAFGGARLNSYVSKGGSVGFHFGIERIVSVLKLEIEGFETKPIKNSGHIPQRGTRAVLGLTLVL